jgi:rhodanese-related sulfurtransferase
VQRHVRFQALVGSVRGGVKEVGAAQVAAELASPASQPLLIDVREDHEWERARIAAGDKVVHLARGVLERDVEQVVPDPARPLVVYCAGGVRSMLAADTLQRMGYTNVRSLAGGLADWARRGLPVDTAPRTR